MAKITKLTPVQEARLPKIAAEWLAIGLSTAPADHTTAEEGVRTAYREVGLEPPSLFLWLRSPLEGSYGAALLATQVWAQVRDQVRDSLWGQHDAGFLSWADFFDVVVKVPGTDVSNGLRLVALSAGWWWAFNGAVVLTERPSSLKRDVRGRLHCEDGPSLLYPDGWGIWSWHGVRVPQDVVEHPETLTAERVLGEQNASVRRVMVERYGNDRLVEKATIIHQDDWGKLLRIPMPYDEPLLMVEVVNSTPEPDGTWKNYYLRVPPTMTKAREAVLWTHNLPADATPLAMS